MLRTNQNIQTSWSTGKMNQSKRKKGRLRKAVLSRLSIFKSPLSYDPYHYMLLGGDPSKRRVCVYKTSHQEKMHHHPSNCCRNMTASQQVADSGGHRHDHSQKPDRHNTDSFITPGSHSIMAWESSELVNHSPYIREKAHHIPEKAFMLVERNGGIVRRGQVEQRKHFWQRLHQKSQPHGVTTDRRSSEGSKDPKPPDEGALVIANNCPEIKSEGDSAVLPANRIISIEQLFEDSYSLPPDIANIAKNVSVGLSTCACQGHGPHVTPNGFRHPAHTHPPSFHHHHRPHPIQYTHPLSHNHWQHSHPARQDIQPECQCQKSSTINNALQARKDINNSVNVHGSKLTSSQSNLQNAHRQHLKVAVKVSRTESSSSASAKMTGLITSSSSVDPGHKTKSHTGSSVSLATSSSTPSSRRFSASEASRSIVSRLSKRLSSASSQEKGPTSPITGNDALKVYSSKLTEKEKSEVKSFKTVYFIGQLASKKAAQEEGEKNDGYDDREGFYVCKAHDHLLYRYELLEILGKGTFGQVAKAWDHKTHSLVALKIVKNERPFLKQAKEEVRILEVLRKQDKSDTMNLVHILDSFKFRGHACITFELLGISLHQLLKKTRGQGFNLGRVQKLTRGILRCLELLGRNHIIHCDIKPENILLRRSASGAVASAGAGFTDLSLKVIDFGSSCYEQQQIYTYIQSRYYRAPEVILGTRYTSAIDVWSLACVIGELLTARPLFAGDDEQDQLAAYIEVCGVPPLNFVNRCKRSEKFFTGETPRYLNSSSRKTKRGMPNSVTLSSILKDTEDTDFLDFMKKSLTWDPSERITAQEAMKHPWIIKGHKHSIDSIKSLTRSGTMPDLTKTKEKGSHSDLLKQTSGNSKKGVKDNSGSFKNSPSSTKSTLTHTSSDAANNNIAPSSKLPSHVASKELKSKHESSSFHNMGSNRNSNNIHKSNKTNLISVSSKSLVNLSRPRSNSANVLSRARAGPELSLPAWDDR